MKNMEILLWGFMGVMVGFVYSLMAAAFVMLGALLIYGIIYLIVSIFVKDRWRKNSILDNAFVVLFVLFIVISLAIGMYLGIPVGMIETAEWEPAVNYVTHDIINLADNNEIEGKFRGRYVRGYIGETTTYHYYYETYDGGMKLQKASEKNTKIYFTDEEPRAEWYSKTRRFWYHTETEYWCKIYIPEGSMTTEFVVDME